MAGDLEKIWNDQEAFNQELLVYSEEYRELRGGPEVAFVKEMILNLASESDELLRTMRWKKHRKIDVKPNRAHTLEELIDQFKIWMTTAQGLGFTYKDIVDGYYRKSMVVRQRASSEWVNTLEGRIVVVDIDQVLCDYITGFTMWIEDHYPQYAVQAKLLRRVRGTINADSMGVPYEEWESVKHHFRISSAKQLLPAMPGAQSFLGWCATQQYTIVLLTSRPISRYPNMHTDTIHWLHMNGMVYDHIWWAENKGDRILEGNIRDKVAFVVDDDPKFVKQMERLGLPTYWMVWERSRDDIQGQITETWGGRPFNRDVIHITQSFDAIMDAHPRLQQQKEIENA